jgi:hypothetical protein
MDFVRSEPIEMAEIEAGRVLSCVRSASMSERWRRGLAKGSEQHGGCGRMTVDPGVEAKEAKEQTETSDGFASGTFVVPFVVPFG